VNDPSPHDSAAWQRRLGRIRLGAEPPADQLARLRRATWALTAIALSIGLSVCLLFAGFRRPGIGIALMCGLSGPIVAGAWLGHLRLARAVAAYESARRGDVRNPGSAP
jgi:hypothetical protein